MNRAIQKYVEDVIAEEIIKSNLQEGDVITMDLKKDNSLLFVKINSANRKSKEEG